MWNEPSFDGGPSGGNGSISLYAVNVCNKKPTIIKVIRSSDGDTNLWRLHGVKEEKN